MATELAQSRRSAATRPAVEPNARALTAAAMKLDPTDLGLARKLKLWQQDWQKYAWDFDEAPSEIHYAHDYYGNFVSRVRIYAGFQSDSDDPPIPLDDFGPADEAPEGSRSPETAAAIDAMQRLDAGADGGLSAIAGDFAVNLALTGEGYLYGKEDLSKPGGESFAVYSVEEFRPSDTGYAIHPRGSQMGDPIGADDYVLRVWRRFRRFRDLADAPMRALGDDCHTLLVLKNVYRAVTSSRAHGGIFLYPDDWTFPQRATDPNAAGQARDDPLTEQMMTAFTTPIMDPSSVAAVMPLLLKGPASSLDKVKWLDIGRGMGDDLLDQIEKCRKGIAVGLDLPVEILTGMGDSNHWSAWQIAEETFKAHIEPLVQVICRALTDGYLWPALTAAGLDPTGYSVWYDPSALIGHTDLFANMKEMHDVFAVSDDALRRAGGANDDDAPDQDEIDRRLYIDQQRRVTIREAGTAPPGEVQTEADLASAPGSAPPNPGGTSGPPPSPASQPAPPALAASGGRQSNLHQLGPRLADIDRVLTAQIQTLADTALQRTLERAGAAVARKVQGARQGQRKTGLAAEIQAVDLDMVPAHVGRDQVLALGLSEDKLIDGQLGQLEPQYRKLTKRALAAALLAGNRAVPDRELSEERQREIEQAQDAHISAGFVVLSAGVLAAAHEQLFTPAQQQAGPGEIDLSTRISPSVIRESLSVAGGTPVAKALTVTSDQTPPAGVAAGALVMDAFKEALEILPAAWQWVYGYPDKPFEPHEVLEGVEFSSWTDEVLANTESWPDEDFYRPGDHLGCACSFIPMFVEDRPNDTPSGDNEAPPEEG